MPSGYPRCGICVTSRPAGFDLALQVQSQLFVKEKVLSGRSTPQSQAGLDELQGIPQSINHGQQQAGQGIEFRHQRQNRIPAPTLEG